MGKLLTQEEVDALLKGLSDGEIETDTPEEEPVRGVVTYDFGNRDRIMRGRMPTVEMINDRFSRGAAVSFSTFLGRMLEVTVDAFEILPYEEFMKKVPEKALFHLFRPEALAGNALLFFDAKLVFLLVDILFGGPGKFRVDVHGKEFSPMEQRVAGRLRDLSLRELEKAWSVIEAGTFEPGQTETNPEFLDMGGSEEIVLAATFLVDLEVDQALMGYCIPYAATEPVRERLYGRHSAGELPEPERKWDEQLRAHLREMPVELGVELGTSEITLRRLFYLREGDILPLNVGPKDSLVFKIQDIPKGTCLAGQRNGNYAVEVLTFDPYPDKENDSGCAAGTPGGRNAGRGEIERNVFAGGA